MKKDILQTKLIKKWTEHKRILNKWAFITIVEYKMNVQSKFNSIIFNDDSIEVIFEKEAHKFNLDDISKLIECPKVTLSIDENGENLIYGD